MKTFIVPGVGLCVFFKSIISCLNLRVDLRYALLGRVVIFVGEVILIFLLSLPLVFMAGAIGVAGVIDVVLSG